MTNKATGSTNLQATVTEVTTTSITFTIPSTLNGTVEILLLRYGKSCSLGTLTFEAHQVKFYTLCYDKEINELAEIETETGTLIWHGLKIPEYAADSRGYVFDETGNELITFGRHRNDKWVINRLNMATKKAIALEIKNLQETSDFDEIISF